MSKQLLKNHIYDTIIVGASEAGLKYLEENNSKDIGFISKEYPVDYKELDNVDYYLDTVEYASFYRGLITLEVSNNKVLLCTHLIIATETKPAESNLVAGFYYKYPHQDIKKNDNIVVIGCSNKAAQLAVDIAKKCKRVYFIDPEVKTQYEPGIRLKIANKKNLQHLTNSIVVANDLYSMETVDVRDGEIISKKQWKITLDNFDEIVCDDIYWLDDKTPDCFPMVKGFLEKDEQGYILVNKENQTTIIPTVYAIGGCCRVKED